MSPLTYNFGPFAAMLGALTTVWCRGLRTPEQDVRFPGVMRLDRNEPFHAAASDSRATNQKARPARMGETLRQRVEELIARYVARMRSDPLIPIAKSLPTPMLEDHALSFLGDLFQSLIVVEKADVLDDREESNLLDDGSRIQILVSELHGAQRHRVGWTEAALDREYEILKEEVARFVRTRAADADSTIDIDSAIKLFNRLLDRAHKASVAAYVGAKRES